MELKELFERMAAGEVAAHSELGTRDESKQSKSFSGRLRKLKIGVGIKAHVLVMKDVVIPFNPFTGSPDDNYNTKTPFRPILLVSQVLEGIKGACAQNPELAATWNKILGKEIDWAAPPSMDDYFAFKAKGYIKPRIMSYSTVALNFGGVAGFPEFRQKYTVDPTQLDENNNYPPENAPIWHKGAIFFNSMLKPEAEHVKSTLEKSGANKEVISTQVRAVYAKSPIGFVNQTNIIPFIYLPYGEALKPLDPQRYSDFESLIRWSVKQDEKWNSPLNEAMTDDAYDDNMDFFDLTMRTPASNETKSNGQVYTDDDVLELYKAMAITPTDSKFNVWTGKSKIDGVEVDHATYYAKVWECAKEYFLYSQGESAKEGGDTFEKLMAASNGFRPISSVVDRLLEGANAVFLMHFADSKYFTENIKKANAEFFTAMNPDNSLALAAYDDDELEDAAKEQQASVLDIIADIRAVENKDDDVVAELSLADD